MNLPAGSAVRPVAAAAPAEVVGTGTSGSTAITVTPGFTGTLTTAVDGLVPADRRAPTLQPTGPGRRRDRHRGRHVRPGGRLATEFHRT